MTNLDEIKKAELDYCRDNPEYYFDKYVHIEVKKTNAELVQPFRLWPKQKEALRSICEHRLNIILKARQLGFSWMACGEASRLMITRPGRTVIALSRSEEEAKELIRRVAFIYSNNPLIESEREKPNGYTGVTYKVSALEIVVKRWGEPPSVMKAFASSPNAGRSFTADLLLMDEHAFQEWAEEIWTAAYPTINSPDGGKVILISTIKRGSLFERLFTDPDNGFNKIFIPWYADPERDQEWYENTKRAMGDLITQEYPATIEEALTVPGGAFFPEVNEVNTVTNDVLEGVKKTYVAIDYGLDMFSAHWIYINDQGEAQVYREYDAPNLTIGQAAEVLNDLCTEPVTLFLAPPDLWNRSQLNGKSRAEQWHEAGVNLTKTSRDFPAGCAAMKEWLRPRDGKKSRLTLLKGEAPNLYNCLKKIQKDDKQPNVYAKKPHDLTHDCLTGDTLVNTIDGDIPIKDLVGKDGFVYAYHKGKRVVRYFDEVWLAHKDVDVYEVELEDGTIIKATADHKILTDSGYKTVSELTEHDNVVEVNIPNNRESFGTCWRYKVCHIWYRFSRYCLRLIFGGRLPYICWSRNEK